MKKNNLGCVGWMVVGLLGLIIIPLILAFAVIGGIIYGMVYMYKNGKFDNITAKINELICKLYNKIFKKELSKPILNPKGFTIVTTILIFLVIYAFGSSEESMNVENINNKVLSEQSNAEKANNTEEKSNQKELKETLETENIIETADAEIHFINTGNSDAILIKQGDKSALIDGGDNDDEGKVVSYLRQQGITELEYIFATHPHADHIGGLDAVVDSIHTKNIYVSNGNADTKTYSDFISSMANKGLNPSVPLLDNEFKLGTSTLKVLSVANESEPNNNSIVLLFKNGEDKVLLMGDAEKEIENKINAENIDLLKVGHHGSNSSSSVSFIEKVSPEYAVITVGENNQYGHPHKETMDTLEGRDIEVHRTDECGHIVFKSSGNGLTVDCKVGSYNAGESEERGTYSNNNNITSTPETNVTTESTPEVTTSENIVYWTPNGKSYHTTKSCPTLSRSKIINSGTQSQSGKFDPCDRCH